MQSQLQSPLSLLEQLVLVVAALALVAQRVLVERLVALERFRPESRFARLGRRSRRRPLPSPRQQPLAEPMLWRA